MFLHNGKLLTSAQKPSKSADDLCETADIDFITNGKILDFWGAVLVNDKRLWTVFVIAEFYC